MVRLSGRRSGLKSAQGVQLLSRRRPSSGAGLPLRGARQIVVIFQRTQLFLFLLLRVLFRQKLMTLRHKILVWRKIFVFQSSRPPRLFD